MDMRTLLLAAASIAATVTSLASGSAMASSIIAVEPDRNSGASVTTETCTDCPPLVKRDKYSYVVPSLQNGPQSTKVEKINGQDKIVRTETWMGGSPVVFISKATPQALASLGLPGDGIDRKNQTAAISKDDAPETSQPLDMDGFTLRLN